MQSAGSVAESGAETTTSQKVKTDSADVLDNYNSDIDRKRVRSLCQRLLTPLLPLRLRSNYLGRVALKGRRDVSRNRPPLSPGGGPGDQSTRLAWAVVIRRQAPFS